MTESSVQNCGLQDHLILVSVIFICAATLKGKCIGTTLALLKPSIISGMSLASTTVDAACFAGFLRQCEVCLRAQGDHFESFL
jgi:hypothetical protein